MQRLGAAMAGASGRYPVPDKLSWDLFLGVAPLVEYHPLYHPFNWRGWVDWGQGALGDMGAHLMDFPVWSLNLGLPTVIETEATPFNGVCYPNATTTLLPVSGAQGTAGRETDVVRRRPDASRSRRSSRTRRWTRTAACCTSGRKRSCCTTAKGRRLLPTSKHNSYGAPKERADARAARRSRDELGPRDQGDR